MWSWAGGAHIGSHNAESCSVCTTDLSLHTFSSVDGQQLPKRVTKLDNSDTNAECTKLSSTRQLAACTRQLTMLTALSRNDKYDRGSMAGLDR